MAIFSQHLNSNFTSYALWRKNIHKEKFPAVKEKYKVSFTTAEIEELNSTVWKAKKEKKLSLKAEVKELIIPKKLKTIEKDLMACHKAKKISYGNKIDISI